MNDAATTETDFDESTNSHTPVENRPAIAAGSHADDTPADWHAKWMLDGGL